MEKLIFKSPKKHKILGVKKILMENNINVTSIKLYIYVEWSYNNTKTGSEIVEKREKSDDLNIPIEEFNEKLNDAETFEVYVDERNEDMAIKLVEKYNTDTFFDNCIFRSKNYDKIFEVYLLLHKNNIPCDDIVTIDTEENYEEYLLFLDPGYNELAKGLIDQKNKEGINVRKYDIQNNEQEEIYKQKNNGNIIFNYISILVLIISILLIRINNEFWIINLIKKIIEYIKQ
jgi:hypothetical protein